MPIAWAATSSSRMVMSRRPKREVTMIHARAVTAIAVRPIA
jgi:hypothetical protein